MSCADAFSLLVLHLVEGPCIAVGLRSPCRHAEGRNDRGQGIAPGKFAVAIRSRERVDTIDGVAGKWCGWPCGGCRHEEGYEGRKKLHERSRERIRDEHIFTLSMRQDFLDRALSRRGKRLARRPIPSLSGKEEIRAQKIAKFPT